jgi:hypothetical protein
MGERSFLRCACGMLKDYCSAPKCILPEMRGGRNCAAVEATIRAAKSDNQWNLRPVECGAADGCACNPESSGTVLEEAARIVGGSRNEAYGDPAGNHGTTADMWTAYLARRGYLVEGARVDARDVCWLNTLQKASRDAFDRRRDNLVDTAGYMRNAELVSDPAAPEHAEPSEAGAPLPAGVHADLRATGTAGD